MNESKNGITIFFDLAYALCVILTIATYFFKWVYVEIIFLGSEEGTLWEMAELLQQLMDNHYTDDLSTQRTVLYLLAGGALLFLAISLFCTFFKITGSEGSLFILGPLISLGTTIGFLVLYTEKTDYATIGVTSTPTINIVLNIVSVAIAIGSKSYSNKNEMNESRADIKPETETKPDFVYGNQEQNATQTNRIMEDANQESIRKSAEYINFTERKEPKGDSSKLVIPVTNYNASEDFQITKVQIDKMNFKISLILSNYSETFEIDEMYADMELFFLSPYDEPISISDRRFRIFIDEGDGTIHTGNSNSGLTENDILDLEFAHVIITKILFKDGVSKTMSSGDYLETNLSPEKLLVLRKGVGEDAICKKTLIGDNLICYCGCINKKDSAICSRCGRRLDYNEEVENIIKVLNETDPGAFLKKLQVIANSNPQIKDLSDLLLAKLPYYKSQELMEMGKEKLKELYFPDPE